MAFFIPARIDSGSRFGRKRLGVIFERLRNFRREKARNFRDSFSLSGFPKGAWTVPVFTKPLSLKVFKVMDSVPFRGPCAEGRDREGLSIVTRLRLTTCVGSKSHSPSA